MSEYLSFQRMITPVFIQVLFWIAVAAVLIAGIVQIADGRFASGLLTIVLGPLLARIYAEILIVLFRINDNVAHIAERAAAPAASPPPAAGM